MLGLIWAFWYILAGFRHSFGSLGGVWLLEFTVVYLATLPPYRILMIWRFARTRSLFAAIVMQASFTGWLLVLFPATSGLQSLAWQSGFAPGLWALVAGVAVGMPKHGERATPEGTTP